MKTCPHCGGEIRPSVIRCVHCGTALEPEAKPATALAGPRRGLASVSPSSRAPAVATAEVADPAPAAAEPDTGAGRPAPDLWATPPDGDGRRPPAATSQAATVATTSARRLDGWVMAAAVLAIATAVVTVSALSLPWVEGRLSVVGQRKTRLVAELTLRASDSYGGTIAIVIAVVMSVLGLLWFWYGTDRANHIPAFAHPALAVIVGLAGWAAIGASTIGSFFWEQAFVEHAQEAGLTPAAMQAILDDRTRRVVELERLAGFQRFGVAATAAVLAGAVAVWSQRPRRSR